MRFFTVALLALACFVAAGNARAPVPGKESVLDKIRTVGDLKVMDLKLEARSPRCLCWADDASAFYHLDPKGVIRRIAVPALVEDAKLEVGKKCSWLSLSKQGLVVSVPDAQEVWVLDGKKLQVKSKVAVQGVRQVAAAPGSAVVVAATTAGLSVIDLDKGAVVSQYSGQDFPGRILGFDRPALTSDGKYLFTEGGIEQIHRFKIDGASLVYEESSPRIIQGAHEGIDLSLDTKLICAAAGGGNYAAENHPALGPYSTWIYAVGDLSRPVLAIKQGPYPRAVGFDGRSNLIYSHGNGHELLVFDAKGQKQKEYKLGIGQVRQILAHPAGLKLLILADRLTWVELPTP
jgi:hypothetical protein